MGMETLNLQKKLTKLMAESYLPQDIFHCFANHYRDTGMVRDARICRLVETLDALVEDWSEPIGDSSVLMIHVTECEKTLIKEDKLIAAIKSVRHRTGLNLTDSKAIVDNYRFGGVK